VALVRLMYWRKYARNSLYVNQVDIKSRHGKGCCFPISIFESRLYFIMYIEATRRLYLVTTLVRLAGNT
jgi:hypothetical protein